jgi:hypothetical protein
MYRRGNYFSKEYFDSGAYAEVAPEISCWQVRSTKDRYASGSRQSLRGITALSV